ncbi:MAG: hypothetical protein DWQ34_24305 [Planctomycetota bacterium]|nr:MAG: hypothetical protein DWQ34_24305 [Planctomycetota bacterium]REJ95606.1 MAG: hypothetical protein DWQ29_01815 [Planctomycetota bacterium]REK27854.1 MAG: hypothetical protein DWQ41_07055 [Planctomycetota bacterium]REK32834.1 MAG: hypothetical protein DWQ45_16630 [Planctomycetota bacterium]
MMAHGGTECQSGTTDWVGSRKDAETQSDQEREIVLLKSVAVPKVNGAMADWGGPIRCGEGIRVGIGLPGMPYKLIGPNGSRIRNAVPPPADGDALG